MEVINQLMNNGSLVYSSAGDAGHLDPCEHRLLHRGRVCCCHGRWFWMGPWRGPKSSGLYLARLVLIPCCLN